MAEDNGTNGGPTEATPEPTPVTEPAQPPRGVSRGAIIALIILIPVVLVATYFGGEIKAFFSLKPWNKSLPRDTVQAFLTALDSNDREGMKSVTSGPLSVDPPDEGPITKVKIGGSPMEPAKDIDTVRPSGSVADARLQYDFRDTKSLVNVHMTAQAGNPVIFVVQPAKGEWRIKNLLLMR